MKLLTGNSRNKLKELEDNSIDALVTDPPYLINFMGKDWDKENSPAGDSSFWEEVIRVMKPGAHGLVFGHSRQHHRVMTALEDAGFEIRDCLMWLYGSGFPKSHNIGKAVQKLSGNVKVIGKKKGAGTTGSSYISNKEDYAGGDKGVFKKEFDEIEITNDWDGWGTALKPAYEPIILVRKPLGEKTVAKNVLKHGTGGININASRIGTEKVVAHHSPKGTFAGGEPDRGSDKNYYENEGRFPANVLLSHHEDCKQVGESTETIIGGNKGKSGFAQGYESGDFTKKESTYPVYECVDDCAVKILDEQAPAVGNAFKKTRTKDTTGGSGDSWTNGGKKAGEDNGVFDGLSGASRFFYCAKVSKKERNAGLDNFEEKEVCYGYKTDSEAVKNRDKKGDIGLNKVKIRKNTHPTVKPIKLMTYLTKLITPPNGIVLDPFMGSGSTGMACALEGFDFVGIDMDEDYVAISEARIEWARSQKK